MEVIGVVLFVTALIAFCLRVSYIRGYKAGATRILNEWKQVIEDYEDVKNS